jgi:HNH endonuclease
MIFTAVDHFSYLPVGSCIYCGSTQNLTREHIVPFSFGGTTILPKSSCMKCAKITRDFEHTCARTIFGKMRMQWGFPTRRKRERPSHIDVIAMRGDILDKNAVSIDRLPLIPIPMPVLSSPGILTGAQPTDTNTFDIKIYYTTEKSTFELCKQINSSVVGFEVKFNYFAFSRMIAKIAHALTIAEYGLDKINSVLQKYIIGGNETISYVVGGAQSMCSTAQDNATWRAESGIFDRGDAKFLTVKIQLFRFLPSCPTYWVVVCQADQHLTDLILSQARL